MNNDHQKSAARLLGHDLALHSAAGEAGCKHPTSRSPSHAEVEALVAQLITLAARAATALQAQHCQVLVLLARLELLTGQFTVH